MDVHPSDGRVGFHPHKEKPQAPYSYPLRALLPRKLANVLAIGRCASTTTRAHGSSRVNGTSMMMGQAAGTVCHLARSTSRSLRDVPVSQIQDALVAGGAILDPGALPARPVHWCMGRVVDDGATPPAFYGELT